MNVEGLRLLVEAITRAQEIAHALREETYDAAVVRQNAALGSMAGQLRLIQNVLGELNPRGQLQCYEAQEGQDS